MNSNKGQVYFSIFNEFYIYHVNFSHTEVTIDELPEGECLDVPEEIWEEASAIDSHGKCVIFYWFAHCRDRFRVFTGVQASLGYVENFSTLGFQSVNQA